MTYLNRKIPSSDQESEFKTMTVDDKIRAMTSHVQDKYDNILVKKGSEKQLGTKYINKNFPNNRFIMMDQDYNKKKYVKSVIK